MSKSQKGYFIVGYMLWPTNKKEREKLRKFAFHKKKKDAQEHLEKFHNDGKKFYKVWVEEGVLEETPPVVSVLVEETLIEESVIETATRTRPKPAAKKPRTRIKK